VGKDDDRKPAAKKNRSGDIKDKQKPTVKKRIEIEGIEKGSVKKGENMGASELCWTGN
jgi:hypothetical protein